MGGTGIAAYLGHRVSRDLVFFVGEPFEPQRLARRLERLGWFAPSQLAAGTLNGYLGETRIQFLDASDQYPVEPIAEIGGIPVAGLRDLLATKLRVIGNRGELRDYFDLLVVELADVADDPTLPASRDEIETYWTRRQSEIVRSLDWLSGLEGRQPRLPGPELSR